MFVFFFSFFLLHETQTKVITLARQKGYNAHTLKLFFAVITAVRAIQKSLLHTTAICVTLEQVINGSIFPILH